MLIMIEWVGGGGGERRKIRSSDKIDKKSQKKKKKKKKLNSAGMERVVSIYTSSTPPAQHCCWSGMHCGNRHTGSQSSPVIKYQSR